MSYTDIVKKKERLPQGIARSPKQLLETSHRQPNYRIKNPKQATLLHSYILML